MKKTVIFIISLILGIQNAFAVGVIVVGTDDDHDDGLNRVRVFASINNSSGSNAQNNGEDLCIGENIGEERLISSECNVVVRFENTCFSATVGSSAGQHQRAYHATHDRQSQAEANTLAACRADGNTICGSGISGCDTVAASSPTPDPDPTPDTSNSCRYANDNQCDDGRFSGATTNLCTAGTDTSDCAALVSSQARASIKDSNNTLLYAGIGVAVVGGFLLLNSGYTEFTPEYGYSATESGYSGNVGGRADFQKDNWNLYLSGGYANTADGAGLSYIGGGEYKGDFWTASFSEQSADETLDYKFALSADFERGIWRISPIYRLHSEYEKGETETDNSLNLEGILRYNGWTIRPAAGFRWENADNFGDNARFRIDAVHRF